jgi:diaminohydroxyphosphoribosylaminopyrimidine deaminase/5-amino-6-(5-phosphoribosylamino)uracil reductase
LASRLLQSRKEGGIIVFCSPERDPARQNLLEDEGIEVIVVPRRRERLSFDSILEELGRREITSLLIEAGPTINFSAFQQRVVDKVCCFIAPRILGGVPPLPFLGDPGFMNLADGVELSFSSIERVGEDVLVEAYVDR